MTLNGRVKASLNFPHVTAMLVLSICYVSSAEAWLDPWDKPKDDGGGETRQYHQKTKTPGAEAGCFVFFKR
jgi:hypothetical protein